jgi:hypothetical protein
MAHMRPIDNLDDGLFIVSLFGISLCAGCFFAGLWPVG